jgi:hypothetical protein
VRNGLEPGAAGTEFVIGVYPNFVASYRGDESRGSGHLTVGLRSEGASKRLLSKRMYVTKWIDATIPAALFLRGKECPYRTASGSDMTRYCYA